MNINTVVDSLLRDFRFALRGLRRRPGFTVAAVLTLALGIGATTAIFSVVYSVLVKPLPYPSSDELVRIRHSAPGISQDDLWADATMYFTYRDENQTLVNVGLWQENSATLSDAGEVDRISALRVTDGTLQVLGVRPILGRWFTEQEHEPGSEGSSPVILSYAFWQRRFSGDEGALGRALSIESPSGNGTLPLTTPLEVVGIMPSDFRFLDQSPQPDIIVPVRLAAQQFMGIHQFQMLARLASDKTIADARADVERMLRIRLDQWPPFPGNTRESVERMQITPVLRALKQDMVGGIAGMLWVLMGAIGAVLVIACANIANLILVRADTRRQEMSTRAALGAKPAQLARGLLVENLVLSVVGTVLGLALAAIGIRVLVAFGPSELPRIDRIAIYPPVLVFTVVAALLSTILFSLAAVVKHGLRAQSPRSRGARGSTETRERNRARSAMVITQVALALVLVISAVLMTRTFEALRDIDAGFADPTTIQTAKTWIPSAEFPDPEQYTLMQRGILERISTLPGVDSVGFVSTVPMEGPGTQNAIDIEGQVPTGPGMVLPEARFKFVSPGYFGTMGTRLIAGRELAWSDIETGGRVAIVSEEFARELSTTAAGALGKRIRLSGFEQDDWREVIGVVQGIHEDGLHLESPSMVYWPVFANNMFSRPSTGWPFATFAVRSGRAGTATLISEIRQAVHSVSANIPVGQERTMQDFYAGSLARTSFTLLMLAIASGMALVLGIVGIYGVVAYVVNQRAREIGIRSALGATPWQLKKMFLLHGLLLCAIGVGIGLIAAYVLARSMSTLLYGIGHSDPVAYVSAILVIAIAAAIASYVPARRAAAIDPMQSLRAE